MAQEFAVRRFRPLPNDITAFMNPVRDLNGEACALIKVVGAADFTFSTPLGIIKRQQEVGEIWLYVPTAAAASPSAIRNGECCATMLSPVRWNRA